MAPEGKGFSPQSISDELVQVTPGAKSGVGNKAILPDLNHKLDVFYGPIYALSSPPDLQYCSLYT